MREGLHELGIRAFRGKVPARGSVYHGKSIRLERGEPVARETHVITDQAQWASIVDELGAHPLQAWGWGELKSKTGPWDAHRLLFCEGGERVGGCQMLVRSVPKPFGAMAYVPRGPFAKDSARLGEMANAAAEWAKAEVRPVCLKIEPGVPKEALTLSKAWREGHKVLLAKTAVMDLTLDEDALMKSIHGKKARQYIRKAGRTGIVCRPAERGDLPRVLELYHGTAENDHFGIHEDAYYEQAFDLLGEESQLFVAEQEGNIQAFLWNVATRACAFELWGAVDDAGKQSRANYLLKWTAMLAAKAKGAVLYDLNGLMNDGISKFKLLFAGEPTYWAGTFDKPLSPLYPLFETALKVRDKHRGEA